MDFLASVIFPKNFRSIPNCFKYGGTSTILAVGDDPGFGCLRPEAQNKSYCDKIGGDWLVPSKPYSKCDRRLPGCNLPFLTDVAFTKTVDECSSCSGYNTPTFTTLKASNNIGMDVFS